VSTAHLPSPDAEQQPYWDAAREHRLLIKRCRACGEPHWYPRPFCPHCWSEDVEWEEASGGATLYTWSVVRRNDLPPFGERVPYITAVVDLDEGPRMLTNLVDVDEGDVDIGMRLRVTWQEDGEYVLPVFTKAGSE
jgi:uncharacterized OB-fold protein